MNSKVPFSLKNCNTAAGNSKAFRKVKMPFKRKPIHHPTQLASKYNPLPNPKYKSKQSQREFLDSLSKKLNIKEPRDWSSISRERILRHKGNGVLSHYKSIYEMLCSVYEGKSFLFPFNRN